MKVSVIVPTYNSLQFLPETLKSAQGQTHQDLEIIVVDDGSSDGTESFFESLLDDRVHYTRLKVGSGGPATPRNVGLQKATGDFICFLDSDDVWHPQKVETQLRQMLSEGLDFTSTRRTIFTENVPSFKLNKESDFYLSYKDLLKKNLIFTSSVMVKASLVKNFQFNTSKERVAVEDYEMWLSMLKVSGKKAKVLGEDFLYYRVHAAGISRAKIKMAKKIWSLLGSEKFELSLMKRCFYFMTYALHSTILKKIS